MLNIMFINAEVIKIQQLEQLLRTQITTISFRGRKCYYWSFLEFLERENIIVMDWIASPQNSYVEVLTHSTLEYDYIWR